MRSFTHVRARTVEEAWKLLEKYNGNAVLCAGGTDLLSALKGEHLVDYPEAVIDIKTIFGLDYIREEDHTLKVGALARLSDMVRSPILRERYKALAEEAHAVAHHRSAKWGPLVVTCVRMCGTGTTGIPGRLGNPLCVHGKGPCLAVTGDNRYHAILGGKKCLCKDARIAIGAVAPTLGLLRRS